MDALNVLADLLRKSLLAPSASEEDGEGAGADAEREAPDDETRALLARVEALVKFCEFDRKWQMANEVIAIGHPGQTFADAGKPCIDARPDHKCSRCGFQRLWSQTLRKKIVGLGGRINPNAHQVWQKEMEWQRLKSGGSAPAAVQEAGEAEKELLREDRKGTPVELLDEFEPVMNKYLGHRCTLQQQKAADTERSDNMRPGWLELNSDWAENGQILNAREIQSEYWTLKAFSLFISITTHLISSVWLDRESPLPDGAEERTREPRTTCSLL